MKIRLLVVGVLLALVGCETMTPAEKFIKENWKETVRVNTKDEGEHIGLPLPYTVPCASGMFQEMYYWDTYFANVGLLLSGEVEQAKNNIGNMEYLINRFGFMPNGNRTYYLGGSQPPFFSRMIAEVYEVTKDKEWLKKLYPTVVKEYEFWQKRRITSSGLNRYSGEFKDDAERRHIAKFFFERVSLTPPTDSQKVARYGETYRAYGEGGWDCSSRFHYDPQDHNWVDLNSLLYGMERDLANFAVILGNGEDAKWLQAAESRKTLMNKVLWNEQLGMFCDYNFKTGKHSDFVSTAVFYPLFFGIATPEQAKRVVALLPRLEQKWGLACSENRNLLNFQWDYPHGWACQQYMVVKGLDRYGYKQEARRIAEKYVKVVDKVFEETGALWEKYDVTTGEVSVTREYESPKMLGWSAGVYLYCQGFLR